MERTNALFAGKFNGDVKITGKLTIDGNTILNNGIRLPTSGTLPTCNVETQNLIDGNATGVYGCNGSTWVKIF
jgi:hypothetical protein